MFLPGSSCDIFEVASHNQAWSMGWAHQFVGLRASYFPHEHAISEALGRHALFDSFIFLTDPKGSLIHSFLLSKIGQSQLLHLQNHASCHFFGAQTILPATSPNKSDITKKSLRRFYVAFLSKWGINLVYHRVHIPTYTNILDGPSSHFDPPRCGDAPNSQLIIWFLPYDNIR